MPFFRLIARILTYRDKKYSEPTPRAVLCCANNKRMPQCMNVPIFQEKWLRRKVDNYIIFSLTLIISRQAQIPNYFFGAFPPKQKHRKILPHLPVLLCSPFPTFHSRSWHNNLNPSPDQGSTSYLAKGSRQVLFQRGDLFTSLPPLRMAPTAPNGWDSSASLANIVAGVADPRSTLSS